MSNESRKFSFIGLIVLIAVIALLAYEIPKALNNTGNVEMAPSPKPAPTYSAVDLNVCKTGTYKVPILVYHTLRDKNDRLSVSPENFAKQMEYLATNGYTTLDMTTLMWHYKMKVPLPAKSVVLTFDDGIESVYTIAYPVVKKYNQKMVLYVVPTWVGTKYFMTWDELKEIYRTGNAEIGSHTLTHIDLDKATFAEMSKEIYNSKMTLETKLNIPIKTFAYPFGELTADARKELKFAGYDSAVTTHEAVADISTDTQFLFPRVYIPYEADLKQFAELLTSW